MQLQKELLRWFVSWELMYHLAGTLLGAALMYVAPRVHFWPLTLCM